MTRFALLSGLAALLWCAGAGAQIYKWTDEQGRVHYSDNKPQGVESEEVSGRLRDAVSTYSPEPLASQTTVNGQTHVAATPVVVEFFPVEFELTRADERNVREEIERIYRRYVDVLGWSPGPRRPVKIRIFGKLSAWDAFPKSTSFVESHRSHYDGRTREVVMHARRVEIPMMEVLRHEVSHAIFDMEIGSGPRWLNEGLAEVFSPGVQGGARLPPNRAGIEITRLKLREGSLEPWARYADLPFNEWGVSRIELGHYRVAASMVSHLLSSDHGTRCLRDVLAQARKSGFGVPSRTFERHCGSLDVLDADWRQWLQRQ